MRYIWIGLAGAVGALLRYAVGSAGWSLFPLGIMAANVLGSLLLGVITGLGADRGLIPPAWRVPLAVGFVGSFTTFSTWMVDSVRLLEQGRLGAGLANLGVSILLGLGAARAGLMLGHAPFRQVGSRRKGDAGMIRPVPEESPD